MTRDDIDRVFKFLGVHFPNSPKLRDEELRKGWLWVLKPFEPVEVNRAIAQCLREKKYFPDVTDISTKCHPPKEADNLPRLSADAGQPQDPQVVAWWQGWRTELRAAGLPTLTEALAGGMSCAEYDALLSKAGL